MDRIKVLTKHQCELVANEVNRLEESWIPRHERGFYSLGAAAYLDAPTRQTIDSFNLEQPENKQYLNCSAQYNKLLNHHFAEVYDAVKRSLTDHLKEKVIYAKGKAKPGFHIFNHHASNAKATSHVPHYDRQYEGLDWGFDVTIQNAVTISYTLPIKIPLAGAGIYFWDIRLEDVVNEEESAALSLVKKAKVCRESYSVGELICHPGHQLHRISPWHSNPDEQRLTLQGHGIFLNGCWQLYW
jgi:hypothetical protein